MSFNTSSSSSSSSSSQAAAGDTGDAAVAEVSAEAASAVAVAAGGGTGGGGSDSSSTSESENEDGPKMCSGCPDTPATVLLRLLVNQDITCVHCDHVLQEASTLRIPLCRADCKRLYWTIHRLDNPLFKDTTQGRRNPRYTKGRRRFLKKQMRQNKQGIQLTPEQTETEKRKERAFQERVREWELEQERLKSKLWPFERLRWVPGLYDVFMEDDECCACGRRNDPGAIMVDENKLEELRVFQQMILKAGYWIPKKFYFTLKKFTAFLRHTNVL